ncbi:MAG TPA: lipoyl synthase [Acidimicrobiia bacterium]|nr:lipoyl synthase [Acidimicrobiia bacterium]
MTRLRARWLGRVAYAEADALQRALHDRTADDYLLLLEHPHVYTLGTRADLEHVLVPPASVGAELVRTDRGGDVTYHGPGQLVGYPIVTLPDWRDGQRDVVAYVRHVEAALVAALAGLGVDAHTERGYTGVWVGDEKIAAIGVKVARGRSRHGFALNVDPDLAMFGHIVPCGIADRGVTSLARVLGRAPEMRDVVDAVVDSFVAELGYDGVERQDVVWREHPSDLSAFTREADAGGTAPAPPSAPVRLLGRLAEAGVATPAPDPTFRRPSWMKVKADLGAGYRETKRIMRSLSLHTVCEEAGCPNIYECWADRTATFMILGERCTRACGFCLVDTRRPLPIDPEEPARVAEAVAVMGLAHAVVTSVARDDVEDGGAAGFAATIRAIRARTPATRVEVLIPDCKGDAAALRTIFDARPDVLNHNLETVARLQRAARPSAAYARSLGVLARAKDAGLTTKSGIILGMGETADEVLGAAADLRAVGVDILTLGQYLRPSARHLPVVRWWTPEEFESLRDGALALGFAHVEAGPLVRSSYHARAAVDAAQGTQVSTGAATSVG